MIVHGTKNVDLFECTNPQLNKWRVRWNIQPDNDQNNEKINENLVIYNEVEFSYKPSIEEIKELIFDWYNQIIDNKILNDFVWVYDNVSYPVWLSSENQFNYKAIYDLAIQTNGKNLPVMFKFGTVEEPVYYTFNTIEELNDFYLKSTKFIQQTLEDGWKEKDTFDFSPYMK